MSEFYGDAVSYGVGFSKEEQRQLAIILARIKNQVPDQVPDWGVITDADMDRFSQGASR